MFNLKIKKYIFSILIILIVLVFLTSCTLNNSSIKSIKTENTAIAGSESSKLLEKTESEPLLASYQSRINNKSPPDDQSFNPKESGAILTVHFINVGQGDSALIQTPDGVNILIDGGPKSSANKVISYLENLGINKINIVISTHPHEDHIGGLISILNNFIVDNVIDSGMPHTTTTYKNYLNAINSNNINYIVPTLGQEFDLGSNVKMQVLGPITKSTSNLNNSSIVIKLTYGNTSFLFVGDAQSKEESQILSKGYDLTSQILKVGHHGSSSSSSVNFLKAVSPSIAIISCGAGNSYGHPHDITLKNLTNLGITIYRTDITGDIIIQSDGSSCNVIQGSPFIYSSQSQATQDTQSNTTQQPATTPQQFVGSINSDVFHYPSCSYVKKIHPENIIWYSSYDDAISKGKRPCKVCNPTK